MTDEDGEYKEPCTPLLFAYSPQVASSSVLKRFSQWARGKLIGSGREGEKPSYTTLRRPTLLMIQWFSCSSPQNRSPISYISVGGWALLYIRINVEATTQLRSNPRGGGVASEGFEMRSWDSLTPQSLGREQPRLIWEFWLSLWRSFHPWDTTSSGLSFQHLVVVVMITLGYSGR